MLAYLALTHGNTVSLKPNGIDFSFTGAGNVNKNSQIFNLLHHGTEKSFHLYLNQAFFFLEQFRYVPFDCVTVKLMAGNNKLMKMSEM